MEIISKKELLQDIRHYKMQKKHFTPQTYDLGMKASSHAENVLELYQKGDLEVEAKNYKIFAEYINLFACADREKLLDMLQSKSSFDIREYLFSARIISIGGEAEYKNYLDAKKLKKQMNEYVALSRKINKNGAFAAYETTVKVEKIKADAGKYIEDFLDGKFELYSDDVEQFREYINVVLYPIYEGGVAQKALEKLETGDFALREHTKKIPLSGKIYEKAEQKTKTIKNAFGKIGKFFSKVKNKVSNWGAKLFKVATATVAVIAAFSVFNDSGSKRYTPDTLPDAKQKKQIQHNQVKKNDTKVASVKVFADTMKQQNTVKQDSSKNDSFKKIMENYFETATKIHADALGDGVYSQLSAKLGAQINNKNLQLPEGVSANQYLYTVVIHKAYGFQTAAEAALDSKTPVSMETMKQISKEVERAADRGAGVKKMAEQIANKNGRTLSQVSNFDKASSTVKKQHIKNLKEWKAAKAKFSVAK